MITPSSFRLPAIIVASVVPVMVGCGSTSNWSPSAGAPDANANEMDGGLDVAVTDASAVGDTFQEGSDSSSATDASMDGQPAACGPMTTPDPFSMSIAGTWSFTPTS